MSVTAIVNQKGGVGKTTVTLGLAAVLAESGLRVLVVDLDPQANATTGAGLWDPERTVADVLVAEKPGSAALAIVSAGWPAAPGVVDLVPSGPGLARVEHDLASDLIGGQDRLALALAGVSERYDRVLIDCAPSLGLLTVNALFAADDVIVVAEPAAWSLDGVEQIVSNVERVAGRRGGRPSIRGIAVNKLARTRDSAHWYEQLGESHAARRIGPPIRLRAVVSEAAAHCLPVTAMNRSGASEAVGEFRALAEHLGLVAAAESPDRSEGGPGWERVDPEPPVEPLG